MKAKSMLFRYLQFLLLVASFAPTTRIINAEENGTNTDNTITATANLLRDSYTIGQQVPIEIVITNHGQEPAYITVDESGFLSTSVFVENTNGQIIYPNSVPSPPTPPPYYWITINGKKIFTVPVIEIASGQTITTFIQDTLRYYYDQLQPGTYYLIPSDLTVIHEVGFIITREDQVHPLWIDPYTVISRARYEINKVEISLQQGRIIYVDDDGPADFSTIQAAIDDANDGDTVLAAPGTYTGEGNRDIDFKGKAITVKSEDGPETCIIDCQGTEEEQHRGFYFHTNEDADSILQGFTITNGYDTYNRGGAIFCDTSSPHIKDCIVTGNAAWYGGGIACVSSNIVIDNCKIIGNWAEKDRGGGILCALGSPHILDCLIEDNTTFKEGGGIKCDNSNITISQCIIRNNSADTGGGIDCHGEVIITNCFITGNNAKSRGGGINCHDEITIINCIITGNKTGGSGGGIRCDVEISLLSCTIFGNSASSNSYGGGGIHLNAGIINNSIIYGNITRKTTGIEIAQGPHGAAGCRPESIKIINSVVGSDPNAVDDPHCYSGEWLHTDPLFANPGYWNANGTPDDPNDDFWVEGDYHLKSQAGRWNPDGGSWIFDYITSPCIDAGDPNMPVSDEPEPNGGRINMGAYGGTPQASKSYILAKIIYVDDDAVGNNDGSSWQDAYTFLQDALTTARMPDVDKPLEIHVAQGIYKPNEGLLPIVAPGPPIGAWPQPGVWPADRGHFASFELINGVTIKGGYAGLGEPDPNARDIELYQTVLSGDLNGDDIEADDPCDLFDEPTRSDNSDNVISSAHNDANAVIDGFTISGGNIWAITFGGGPPIGGAGMLISSGSPTLIDCKFTRNVTGNYGGGLLIYGDGNPTLINCVFTENYADWGAGIYNGASSRVKRDFSSPKFINCTFNNNYAGWIGGGIYNEGGNSSLLNCTFIRNSNGGFCGGGSPEFVDCEFIQNNSGGIYSWGSPRLTNCIFSSNSTKYYGGGMSSEGNYGIILTNCIFSGNSAGRSGGGLVGRDLVLNNCIFTGNKVSGDKPNQEEGGGCVLFGDNITMTNCTFYGNWAKQGRAISKSSDTVLRINNCILWDGGDEISRSHPSTLAVIYSDIQESLEGEGNINVDPLFTDPGYWADADDPNIVAEPNDPNAVWVEGDYHLKSQAGRWDPVSQSWVQDDVTSSCIDAGDPNSPIGYEPFPNGWIINMGAYGGTPQASKS